MACKKKKKISKKVILSLWSELIRKKYNRTCIMCGKSKGNGDVVQAHHAIVRKAQGNYAAFDLRNGVCLCYNCHINKLHGEQADFEFIQKYTNKINELYPEELKEQIRESARKIIKTKDLVDIRDEFKRLLNYESC